MASKGKKKQNPAHFEKTFKVPYLTPYQVRPEILYIMGGENSLLL